MKVCLHAPDSKMINHAILKIAQHHINAGHVVKWYEPLFDQDANYVYVSKIFTFTKNNIAYPEQAKVIKGGTGYEISGHLPKEIEDITNVEKAYKLLYSDKKYSIIFTTRGCIRNCAFCLVRQKEGLTHDVDPISVNPDGKHIEVFDNNFFSSNTWQKRLEYLKKLNQPINFNTGIDIRTITENQAIALKSLKIKRIHCAWDSYSDKEAVIKGLNILKRYISPSAVTVYVLVGYETEEIIPEDVERAETIWDMGYYPFAMPYKDFNNVNHTNKRSVKEFARWVNRYIYKKVKFKDYSSKAIHNHRFKTQQKLNIEE